jgi:hypothetical protein
MTGTPRNLHSLGFGAVRSAPGAKPAAEQGAIAALVAPPGESEGEAEFFNRHTRRSAELEAWRIARVLHSGGIVRGGRC